MTIVIPLPSNGFFGRPLCCFYEVATKQFIKVSVGVQVDGATEVSVQYNRLHKQ